MEHAHGSNNIVYFNDSTMGGFTAVDTGEARASDLLAKRLRRPVFGISGPGFTPVVYADILAAVGDDFADKAGTIVFQINMRSFSHVGFFTKDYYAPLRAFINAYGHPPSALTYLACLADGAAPQACFHGLYAPGPDPAEGAVLPTGPPPLPDKAAQDYREAYCNRVDDDHPMLARTRAVCAWAAKRRVRLVLYFTPINIDRLESLLGPGCLAALRDNVRRVRAALADQGATVLDYSELLRDDDFNEPWYANEHLSAQGRERLVDALAAALTRDEAPHRRAP